ncbi:CYTH and CHAD domain-containing protein [Flavisphingomonas formosensis]|uniref:CYTH and CHAD domain-containing protein n=1 Tax=Flavisphingomonas formosensis TaxID=861534 RepID=UPI0012F77133|nr:CHAD domain-containing protein [Sphingomonas formosensis]
MAQEVELKLELTPAAADALERSGLLPGMPQIVRQRSVYFDTPDHALSEEGMTLRIRHVGRKRVQTVKAEGGSAAGLFARPEWEFGVKSDTPVLDERTPIRALFGAAADTIVPLFEVSVERRTWIVEREGAKIELVLDRGEANAGERSSPICELELEQKHGKPDALFALARHIDAHLPVHLGVLTKSERGFRLLKSAKAAVKTGPVALKPDLDAAHAFQHIAQSCLRQFRLNEALLFEQHDPNALHQARVALRRLRSAFTIHKEMLGDLRFGRLREETRWLALALADARSIDVLIEQNEDPELSTRLLAARDQAYHAAETALHSERARTLMLDLVEWIALGDWLRQPLFKEMREQPAPLFAAAALDRFRGKVKKSGKDLAGLDDEARHELRKAAKKLRYASEFFHALFDGKRAKRRYKRFISTLEELQDRLGALNDMATAPELLDRLGLADAPGAAPLIGTRHKRKLLDTAADAHDALLDCKRFWR